MGVPKGIKPKEGVAADYPKSAALQHHITHVSRSCRATAHLVVVSIYCYVCVLRARYEVIVYASSSTSRLNTWQGLEV